MLPTANYKLLTILGPTACGKTTLACALAHKLGAEIISADSRQVYRGMDIGTGKDLAEYKVGGEPVSYHLIDICEAGEKYNVFEFQHDFHKAFSEIQSKGKLPILCGGTGMYIESVLRGYKLPKVPENTALRQQLEGKTIEELSEILSQYVSLHNKSDLDSAKRTIRAIEIAEYSLHNEPEYNEFQPLNSLIIGLDLDRELRRERITKRLTERMNQGMIHEVKSLLDKGIPAEDLIYYGLEYKFVTQYLTGELSYKEMFTQLEIAIHQFAKRQMTWFRGMERRGFTIHWISAELPLEEKVEKVLKIPYLPKPTLDLGIANYLFIP
ncbi:MAG: tRNA (adenosine(37)-N6)-dimethylallyltransferase MiaA [Paludibacter sp.]